MADIRATQQDTQTPGGASEFSCCLISEWSRRVSCSIYKQCPCLKMASVADKYSLLYLMVTQLNEALKAFDHADKAQDTNNEHVLKLCGRWISSTTVNINYVFVPFWAQLNAG